MTTEKLDALAESVFVSVKSFIARSLQKFEAKVAALEQRIDAIPIPKDGQPGLNGKDGIAGRDGRDGKDGKDGAIGPQGPAGVGKAGVDGERGPMGPQGERGVDGERGAIGLQGPRGENGEPGLRGERGEQGERGLDGVGLLGERGERGERGEPGPQGEVGPRGADGLSAYAVAKSSGFVGSEGEWLLTLRGLDGAAGRDGKDGAAGLDGQDGRDGRDGLKGDAGRDALELEVLDGIDRERSYARGTFASFNGGTFRAARETEPLSGAHSVKDAGWQCVMRGIQDIAMELEGDGRYILQTVKYADGSSNLHKVKTAMQINRGVYQSAASYEAGDVVTFNGSQWVALGLNSGVAPPADSWKLCVKHGRDGKDGAPGRAGRDLTQLGPDGSRY